MGAVEKSPFCDTCTSYPEAPGTVSQDSAFADVAPVIRRFHGGRGSTGRETEGSSCFCHCFSPPRIWCGDVMVGRVIFEFPCRISGKVRKQRGFRGLATSCFDISITRRKAPGLGGEAHQWGAIFVAVRSPRPKRKRSYLIVRLPRLPGASQ
jgi:hypothetical protein